MCHTDEGLTYQQEQCVRVHTQRRRCGSSKMPESDRDWHAYTQVDRQQRTHTITSAALHHLPRVAKGSLRHRTVVYQRAASAAHTLDRARQSRSIDHADHMERTNTGSFRRRFFFAPAVRLSDGGGGARVRLLDPPVR